MMWAQVFECETQGNLKCFQNAMDVWINRPNVCSKRVSCALVHQIFEDHDITPEDGLEINNTTIRTTVNYLSSIIPESNAHETFIRRMIPKKADIFNSANELIIQEKFSVFFIPLIQTGPDFEGVWFKIEYRENDNNIVLYLTADKASYKNEYFKFCNKLPKIDEVNKSHTESCYPTKAWVIDHLMPTLCKWTNQESEKLNGKEKCTFVLPDSLSLIRKQKYAETYEKLKLKYGKELVKIWPEVTDPKKFVYEDVAIASYLILLWESERKMKGLSRKQTFVDLGCGNGLLTFILTSEGHRGKGIDLRRRKIWSHYPEKINLQESVIDPTNLEMVSGYDWLLGNHSDELTPWIPVMTTRIGYDVRYWVLPCCFYDLYGKYKRKTSLHGQYEEYLSRVSDIGRVCGFNVQTDVMRIPSTKRVCQIGMSKAYAINDHGTRLNTISEMLEECKSITGKKSEFVAREKVEKVRNCTRIERSILDDIISIIVSKLLDEKHIKEIKKQNEIILWNAGGKIPLKDIAKILDKNTKKCLKSECGGLKTLLRNNKQIFEITEDCVQIRQWYDVKASNFLKSTKSDKLSSIKTKPCWFHNNHPDKCPREDKECTFIH